MKIFVTGTRGIPDIPGGVEKHCQELYPHVASAGHTVCVATRKPYVVHEQTRWKRIQLKHVFAPRIKSLEAIIHTFLAVCIARKSSPDIVHIHAVGPGLVVPFARMLGLKVVVTNHGPDYDRQKWSGIAKHMLKLGEWLGGRFAHEVIVISEPIKTILRARCKRSPVLIPNGVQVQKPAQADDFVRRIGAEPRKYILAVARFVPEKGLHDLVQSYTALATDYKLVIAGDADHETEYSRNLRQMAKGDQRIVLTGYLTGEPLHQLYSHAGLFVLPSYHEGLPIVLLEAMSYGLPVLVSDIAANLEVDLPENRYFECGNVQDLQDKMKSLLNQELSELERQSFQRQIAEKYNWQTIAEQTIAVYERVLSEKGRKRDER
jgi:glycosyltransferase involved in cell wall biosynthesis